MRWGPRVVTVFPNFPVKCGKFRVFLLERGLARVSELATANLKILVSVVRFRPWPPPFHPAELDCTQNPMN